MAWIGWIMIGGAAAAAVFAPRAVLNLTRIVGAAVDRLARRRALAITGCALLSLAGSALVARFVKWPEPLEHDEFSYLLAGDTFAHGRLANPTHQMWRFFETFHVIQEPTCASKYPPAQGLALAAGQVACGHPIAGVWASGALMAAAICWMLFGFLPGRWALAGGLLAVAQFGIASSWTQSYWGGAVAACGGALVFGALPRIVGAARVRDAILLAIGVAILANSRPFEGLVAVLPAAAVLFAWMLRGGKTRGWRALARVVVPIVLVLIPAAAWMALYNAAVTGSAWRFPYWVYEQSYPAAPAFLWLDPAPFPTYRLEVVRKLCEKLLAVHAWQRTLEGFRRAAVLKASLFWTSFIGPYLSVALVAWPWLWKRRWMKVAAAALLLMVVALLGETVYMAHYFAPVTAVMVLALTFGLRVWAAWRPAGRPVGIAVAYAVLAVALVFTPTSQLRMLRHPPPPEWRRSEVLAGLEAGGRRHLVIVRYGKEHLANELGHEWVYNHADIDASAVVWAHDMGEALNRPLLAYYPDRQVSLLEIGFTKGSVALTPYPR